MNRRRAGFTLIELALVAILLLTVVGLSIPVLKKTFIGLYAQDTSFNISKLISAVARIRADFAMIPA